jgi:hypothetical protein
MIRTSSVRVLVLDHCVEFHLLLRRQNSANLCSVPQVKRLALAVKRLKLRVALVEDCIQLLLLIRRKPHSLAEALPGRRRMPGTRMILPRAPPHVSTPQMIAHASDEQAEDEHHQH